MKISKNKMLKYSFYAILFLFFVQYSCISSLYSNKFVYTDGKLSLLYDIMSPFSFIEEKEPLNAIETQEISDPITYLDTINLDQLADCLAIDPITGFFYIYYPRSYCVKAYDKNFNYFGTIGTEGEEGTDNNHFGIYAATNTPYGGMKVSKDGRLFVSDPQNQRVQVFNTTDLSYIATIDTSTYTPYGDCPFGLDIGTDGSLYVAIYNGPVVIFDNDLTFIDSNATTSNMHTVAIDSQDRIYAGHGNIAYHEVPVYNRTDGSFLYGITSVDGTAFSRPVIIRTDYRDNLYVVCDSEHRVQILNKTHGLIGTIGIPNESGDDNEHLNNPLDIAFYKGRVFVLDHNNNRIQIFAIFQTHKQININGNVDFKQYVANEVWAGNGTFFNPYIIEGYVITGIDSEHLVSVINTDVYFLFRECFLNNKYIDGSRGVSFSNVSNSKVSDNVIYNTASDAVWLEQNSIHNEIINNIVAYTGSYRSGGNAIGLLYSSNNNIYNNTVHKYSDGIYLGYSSQNNIYKNIIDDCDRGIWCHAGAYNNSISYNHVSNCEQWAVVMNPSAYDNVVIKNTFIGNNIGESQAFDENGNNIFDYNYWDDWTNPDKDFDYLVDFTYLIQGSGNNTDPHPRTTPDIILFVNHDPIYIDDNEDFTTLGFPGKGTKNDPYLIEGYSISGSETLIEIWHTTAYFKVHKNRLNGITKAFDGIYFYNVTHGTLDDNIMFNCSSGISQAYSKENSLVDNYIIDSNTGIVHISTSKNIFEGNRVHASAQTGIYLFNSNCTTFSHNEVLNSSNAGIHLESCHDNILVGNYFDKNVDSGICIDSSNNNTLLFNVYDNNGIGIIMSSSNINNISENLVSYSLYSGIDLSTCNYNTLFNNTIFENNDNGILLANSTNNNIIDNIIFQNDRGIHLHSINNQGNIISRNIIEDHNSLGIILDNPAENNQINRNYFLGNNPGNSQAEDNGVNNIFSYNFWDEWTTPDENADGIVDNPYPISGSTDNFDNFPRVFGLGHYLSQLRILSPKGGEVFMQGEEILIQWSTTLCSINHSVTYSVSYSWNSGETWIILASNLIETEFSWDTNNVNPGNQFLIMVTGECSEGETIVETIGQTFEISEFVTISTTSTHTIAKTSTSTYQQETKIPSIQAPINISSIIVGLILLTYYRSIIHKKRNE